MYMARGFMSLMRVVDITRATGRVGLKVEPVLCPRVRFGPKTGEKRYIFFIIYSSWSPPGVHRCTLQSTKKMAAPDTAILLPLKAPTIPPPSSPSLPPFGSSPHPPFPISPTHHVRYLTTLCSSKCQRVTPIPLFRF
jgi:hypothetical protein